MTSCALVGAERHLRLWRSDPLRHAVHMRKSWRGRAPRAPRACARRARRATPPSSGSGRALRRERRGTRALRLPAVSGRASSKKRGARGAPSSRSPRRRDCDRGGARVSSRGSTCAGARPDVGDRDARRRSGASSEGGAWLRRRQSVSTWARFICAEARAKRARRCVRRGRRVLEEGARAVDARNAPRKSEGRGRASGAGGHRRGRYGTPEAQAASTCEGSKDLARAFPSASHPPLVILEASVKTPMSCAVVTQPGGTRRPSRRACGRDESRLRGARIPSTFCRAPGRAGRRAARW